MSATNTLEEAIVAYVFNGTAITLFDGVTEFWLSLHTADPGETGSQNTSEASYTGYERLSITRDSSGWTCSGNTASNVDELAFGQCSASPGSSLTYVGCGLDETGAGTLLFRRPLANEIVMAVGATPRFAAGALTPNAE